MQPVLLAQSCQAGYCAAACRVRPRRLGLEIPAESYIPNWAAGFTVLPSTEDSVEGPNETDTRLRVAVSETRRAMEWV